MLGVSCIFDYDSSNLEFVIIFKFRLFIEFYKYINTKINYVYEVIFNIVYFTLKL